MNIFVPCNLILSSQILELLAVFNEHTHLFQSIQSVMNKSEDIILKFICIELVNICKYSSLVSIGFHHLDKD